MNKIKIGSIKELNKLAFCYNKCSNSFNAPFATLKLKEQEVILVIEEGKIEISLMKVVNNTDLEKLIKILKALQFNVEMFDLKNYLKNAIDINSCYSNKYFKRVEGKITIAHIDFSENLPIGTYIFSEEQYRPTTMEIEETLYKLNVTDEELQEALNEIQKEKK